MRLLGFFLVILIILSATLPTTNALTMKDKAKQLQERDAALKKIANSKPVYVSNMIVIELSPACIAYLKAGIKDKCVSYEDLANQFDTTNQVYSGKFFNDNGFYHRAKPAISNHEIVYKWINGTTICVDCYGRPLSQAKQILVEPQVRAYTLDSDRKMINNTHITYHDLIVEDCFKTRVTSSLALIQDTINYLESGCKTKSFNEKEIIKKPLSKLSYDGNWYSYKKWLDEAKKLATKNCIKSTEC